MMGQGSTKEWNSIKGQKSKKEQGSVDENWVKECECVLIDELYKGQILSYQERVELIRMVKGDEHCGADPFRSEM